MPAASSPSGQSGPSHHKVLSSVSRIAILEQLRSRAQPLGVVEIAQHVGLHQNTVRSHLDLLVDSGYALRYSEAPNRPGRPRVVYEATSAPEGERDYRLLAEVLAQHLFATSEHPGEAAVNAGRSWAVSTGRKQQGADEVRTLPSPPLSQDEAVAAVVRMLAGSGFAPQLSADGTSINLHRCPFRELAEREPAVVCGAHLGLIQGALAELGTMVAATGLLPFVTPGLCVATLTRPAADPAAS